MKTLDNNFIENVDYKISTFVDTKTAYPVAEAVLQEQLCNKKKWR